jgi:hypothetical protein
MSDDAESTQPRSRAQNIGRRIGQAVYYLAVGAFASTATWQITQQIFYPDPPAKSASTTSCEAGLRRLLSGIEAAKDAASRQDELRQPDETLDPEAALNRFRAAITPTWADRDAIGDRCTAPEHKRLLDALDRLRYSEEHGVRKQAAELTALRLRVSKMAAEVLLEETSSPEKDEHHER